MNDCLLLRSNFTIASASTTEANMKNNRQRIFSYILMGIGLVLVAAGVYELVRPDEFRSQTRVKLESYDCGCLLEEGAEHADHYPDFAQAELKNLKSDVILSNVVYRLELREKWAKKHFNEDTIKTAEAVRLMRARLDLRPVRNTTLVDIMFTSDDADEAASIANTIAEVRRDLRIVKQQRFAMEGRLALKRELEIEEKKIEIAKDELDRLRMELKIPDNEAAFESSRTNYPAYWNKRRNLEELNDLRRLITRKINIEELDLKLSHHTHQEILEYAVPSKTPVGYHWRRGRTLTILGLVVLSCGVVFHQKSKRTNV